MSFHCDVTIVQQFDSLFDCDVKMKKSVKRWFVRPLANGKLHSVQCLPTLCVKPFTQGLFSCVYYGCILIAKTPLRKNTALVT